MPKSVQKKKKGLIDLSHVEVFQTKAHFNYISPNVALRHFKKFKVISFFDTKKSQYDVTMCRIQGFKGSSKRFEVPIRGWSALVFCFFF